MIFFLTGHSGSGKTTLLTGLAGIFAENGVSAGGFIAPGTWHNGKRSGFIIHDLRANQKYLLAETNVDGPLAFGRFVFKPETIDRGNQLLISQLSDSAIEFIFVDEVGPFELAGNGWAPALNQLAEVEVHQLWVVRNELVEAVANHWKIIPAEVFLADKESPDSLYSSIKPRCLFQKNDK